MLGEFSLIILLLLSLIGTIIGGIQLYKNQCVKKKQTTEKESFIGREKNKFDKGK